MDGFLEKEEHAATPVWDSRSSGIPATTSRGVLQENCLAAFAVRIEDLGKCARRMCVNTAIFPKRQLWQEELQLRRWSGS